MKSDIEVIDVAIALIEKDGGWCKGSFCKDKNGDSVGFYTDKAVGAVSFCLEGAIRYSAGAHIIPGRWEQANRLDVLARQLVFGRENDKVSLTIYNDGPLTTQEDAILVLKRVRSHLEEQMQGD